MVSGRMMRRNSRLRWIAEPAMNPKGHSRATMNSAMMRLMICNTGTGLTAGSSVLVKKSQKILGQKKPSRAAANWSVRKRLVWKVLWPSWRDPTYKLPRS